MSDDIQEPLYDVAHLGHIEVETPTPDDSLRFFVELLGMEIEARQGQSVYLRGFRDYERYCVKLTETAHPGLGHVALRTTSVAALHRRVASIERSGHGLGWTDGDVGHGPAYRFSDPDGHVFELYHESERYRPTETMRARLAHQPQRFIGRGVGVHRLEHVTLFASDVGCCRQFMQEHLGFRLREAFRLNDGREAGAWMSVTAQAHELTYVLDRSSAHGRFHHAAFWVDSREDVMRSADIFADNDVFIEAGPGKHTIVGTVFLYVYEPGGNRIEVTHGGYLAFDPNFEPIVWTEAEFARGPAWATRIPDSFNTYGTPIGASR